jgi:heme-degrading monooxygenase HmoA
VYVRIWRFRVAAGRAREFERAYGADGAWARLFRRGHGYLSTELLQSAAEPGVYLTIDRWRSADAFEDFLRLERPAYNDLDRRCARLWIEETDLGSYEPLERRIRLPSASHGDRNG